MNRSIIRGTFGPLLAAALVVGCTEGEPGSGVASRGTFKADYLAARGALEAGRYDRAVKDYSDLIGRSGPMTSRMRLEYAHALLRADRLDEASLIARRAAAENTGLARASALSVQATADHEIARAAMSDGRYDREVYDRLVAARTAFDEILDAHKEVDPIGGLATRRAEIANAEASMAQTLGL